MNEPLAAARLLVEEVAETHVCYRIEDGYDETCRAANLPAEKRCVVCRCADFLESVTLRAASGRALGR